MQATLTYRYDQDDNVAGPDGSTLEAVRITVKRLTIRQVGEQARKAAAATKQWQADHGLILPQDAPPGSQAPEPTPEQLVYYSGMMKWTIASAATSKVQIVKRTKKSLDLDPDNADTWPWQESSLTALGWDEAGSALDMPTDLINAWDQTAQSVNPGTFGRPLTSQPKKTATGVIGVT